MMVLHASTISDPSVLPKLAVQAAAVARSSSAVASCTILQKAGLLQQTPTASPSSHCKFKE